MRNGRPMLTKLGTMFAGQTADAGEAGTGYLSRITRLGPMFTNEHGTVTAATSAVVDAPPPPPLAPGDDTAVKARIKDLAARHKAGDAGASVELAALRDAEYARPDGGRLPVKRTLSFAGFGKP